MRECGRPPRGLPSHWQADRRDSIYRAALGLVRRSWGVWDEVADGLLVLLLVWNRAFYQWGPLDANAVEVELREFSTELYAFRNRALIGYSPTADDSTIRALFGGLLAATGTSVRGKRRVSPVSVAKTLHVLAPEFFPLWDDKIASAAACYWGKAVNGLGSYLRFIGKIHASVTRL